MCGRGPQRAELTTGWGCRTNLESVFFVKSQTPGLQNDVFLFWCLVTMKCKCKRVRVIGAFLQPCNDLQTAPPFVAHGLLLMSHRGDTVLVFLPACC